MVQTNSDVTDENVNRIHNIAGNEYKFSDRRDQKTTSTYMAFLLFVYGFTTS